ncbi:hypothetical protein FIA58_000265 [Flavobacterium jejuense]|uniref:Cyclic nucleotide-binding domain-containing protein n=1 Tax=Flavobacterium jejuense TaxID=1544455 RepID=A0ABX0IJT6_9FLAO|nr:hypothetical protein [Flavobacterium jejuense]NHN24095.1 hypothetical protein [Flavobacterium jejuense]
MLHSLQQFTRKYMEFNATELVTLASLFKPIACNENAFVIKKRQHISNIYFLNSGVLKSYRENNNRKYNVKLYYNPILFSDLNALTNRTPSTRNFVITKKATVFMANFEDIIRLNAKSEKHDFFFKMIFEEEYMFNSNGNT